MRYFDISILVPLILPEATSEPIARLFEDLPADDPAVSDWTRVESASLLAREVRMGHLDAAAAREAGARFDAMVEESFVVLQPNRDDFDIKFRKNPEDLGRLLPDCAPESLSPSKVPKQDDDPK